MCSFVLMAKISPKCLWTALVFECSLHVSSGSPTHCPLWPSNAILNYDQKSFKCVFFYGTDAFIYWLALCSLLQIKFYDLLSEFATKRKIHLASCVAATVKGACIFNSMNYSLHSTTSAEIQWFANIYIHIYIYTYLCKQFLVIDPDIQSTVLWASQAGEWILLKCSKYAWLVNN